MMAASLHGEPALAMEQPVASEGEIGQKRRVLPALLISSLPKKRRQRVRDDDEPPGAHRDAQRRSVRRFKTSGPRGSLRL